MNTDRLALALAEIVRERHAQDEKFPDQHDLPDGTGGDHARTIASIARSQCEAASAEHKTTWKDILREEYAEAMAETEQAKLRAELIQVAAVCVKWIEWIDRRGKMLRCQVCKLVTSALEAESRKYNTGACKKCGGALV